MCSCAGCDDIRDSLAFKLRKALELECEEVLCADPHLKDDWLMSAEEVVERADVLFIGAPHRQFEGLDYRGKPVIDIWNFTEAGSALI